MPFVSGDRVRLIKSVALAHDTGPPIGAVGTVMQLEIPAAQQHPAFWCVKFDDFTGQFNAMCRPGIWFVEPEDVELLARQ